MATSGDGPVKAWGVSDRAEVPDPLVCETWWEATELAHDIARKGYRAARDKGVAKDRMDRMWEKLQACEATDHDAYYALVTEKYAEPAADAVYRILKMRAEALTGPRDDPTDPVVIIPSAEAFPEEKK